MPARLAARIPSTPWACAVMYRPRLWASSAAAAEDLQGKRRNLGIRGRRGVAAGGHDLDAVRAFLIQELRDRRPDRGLPFRLAAPEPAVARGRRDRPAGREDPWTQTQASGDRVPDAQARLPTPPAVEHGGDPGAQHPLRRSHAPHEQLLVGAHARVVHHRVASGDAQVDVLVDEPGQDRGARDRPLAGPLRTGHGCRRTRGHDPVPIDEHRHAALEGRCAGAVDQPVGGDSQQAHRARPAAIRSRSGC